MILGCVYYVWSVIWWAFNAHLIFLSVVCLTFTFYFNFFFISCMLCCKGKISIAKLCVLMDSKLLFLLLLLQPFFPCSVFSCILFFLSDCCFYLWTTDVSRWNYYLSPELPATYIQVFALLWLFFGLKTFSHLSSPYVTGWHKLPKPWFKEKGVRTDFLVKRMTDW